MNAVKMKMRCQGCAREGVKTFGSLARPRWCRCSGRGFGPIVAAPGTIVRMIFEGPKDAAFRERCRVLGIAERAARDELSKRYVRCGRGWRELPESSPKRRALYAAHDAAIADLERAQAECPHDPFARSMFDRETCGVCYAHVESDVAQHRHLVREGLYREEQAS